MEIVGNPNAGESAVSMEDAVHALIDLLVDPLLPSMDSMHAPATAAKQFAIGSQMHTVVLLCNYYHRKQFPELKCLDYETFCKVALKAKPTLGMYMKSIMEMEAGKLNNQPSIMEKMIMDACNISSTLDSSKKDPDVDGWPISQVAVLLVDSKRVKCYLEFGSITKGVWSLVENELNSPIEKVMMGADQKIISKKKRYATSDGILEKEDLFEQLAFSALNQKTGHDPSKFKILGHYIAYSLNRKKTVTRLYIMKSTESVSRAFEEFSIDGVLNCLRGPIITGGNIPEVTSVVEYYHLLPYVNALTDWLTRYRKATPSASLKLLLADPQVSKECSYKSDVIIPGHQDHGTHKLSDQTNREMPISSGIAGLMTDETAEIIKRDQSFGENSSNNACGLLSSSNILLLDMNMMNERESNKPCDEGSTFLAQEPLIVERDNNSIKKNNLSLEEDLARSVKENRSRKCQSTVNEDESSRESAGVNSKAAKKLRTTEDNREYFAIVADEAINKNKNNSSSGKDSVKEASTPKAHAVDLQMVADAGPAAGYQEVGFSSTITENNSNKTSYEIITSLPEKSNAMENKYGDINQTVQDAIGPSDSSLLAIKSPVEVQYDYDLAITSKKDDLRDLLTYLKKKREELSRQKCCFEDQIAYCEINIMAIQSDLEGSGKLGVESVLEAINELLSSQISDVARSQPKDTEFRKLSEANFDMKNPFEELEETCGANCWASPKYNVLPSFDSGTGKFRAIVTVTGVDFQFSVNGDLKCNPSEARLSAASKIMSTLSSMAGQAQNE